MFSVDAKYNNNWAEAEEAFSPEALFLDIVEGFDLGFVPSQFMPPYPPNVVPTSPDWDDEEEEDDEEDGDE